MAIVERWLLSVSLKPNGDLYSKHTLIDRRKQRSKHFNTYKHCLPIEIAERLALVKLNRADYKGNELGIWIGARHFIVFLSKAEHDLLLEMTNDNTGTQGKGPHKENFRKAQCL